jgi:hypothetical protein
MNSAEKQLEDMRATKSGWKHDDFKTLYTGFGFVEKQGAKHTRYTHAKYRLVAIVARHTSLPPGYAKTAVKLIDELKRLELEDQQRPDGPSEEKCHERS